MPDDVDARQTAICESMVSEMNVTRRREEDRQARVRQNDSRNGQNESYERSLNQRVDSWLTDSRARRDSPIDYYTTTRRRDDGSISQRAMDFTMAGGFMAHSSGRRAGQDRSQDSNTRFGFPEPNTTGHGNNPKHHLEFRGKYYDRDRESNDGDTSGGTKSLNSSFSSWSSSDDATDPDPFRWTGGGASTGWEGTPWQHKYTGAIGKPSWM